MYQQVTLIGYLGKDPEVKSMQSGDQVANLSVATSERWKDKSSGEKMEKTEWHRVVVFGPAAGFVGDYCNKGDLVHVVGKIQTRKWTDQSGVEKYSTEIVVSGFGTSVTKLNKTEGNRRDDGDDETTERGSRGRSRSSGRSSEGSSRRSRGDDSLDDDSGSSRGGGKRRSSRDDLDDDIPF